MAKDIKVGADIITGNGKRGTFTSPPVQGSTGRPVETSTRKVASYKIAETVWRDFANYVKQLNVHKTPGTETEIGAVAQAALVEYMHNHPVEG